METNLSKAFQKVSEAEKEMYQFADDVEKNGTLEDRANAAKIKEAIIRGDSVLQSPWMDGKGQSQFRIGSDMVIKIGMPLSYDIPMSGRQVPCLPEVYNAPQQPAQIYPTLPLDYRKYKSEPEPKAEIIAQKISSFGRLKTYKDNFFFLRDYPHCFELLRGNDVQRMLSYFCRECLKYECDPTVIDRVVKILLYDDRLAVKNKQPLPLHIWAFADGLVDIRTGQRIPDIGSLFFTRCLQCDFVPGMECPQFDRLVESISGGNLCITERLWQIIGYILSNDTKAKAFFTFAGPKDTGKSLIANVITDILQEDAVACCGVGDFGGRFVAGNFVDRRLVTCMDATNAPLGAKAVGAVKSITGGDKVPAEKKFKDAETVRLDCVFLFGTNHSIRTETPDPAFSEREVLVPFLYPVPKEKQDKFLLEKLKSERSGIVNKALQHYLRLVADNYVFCPIGNIIPEDVSIDPVKVILDFSKTCCDFSDENAKVSTMELFLAYESFCEDRGLPKVDKNAFSGIFNKINPTAVKKKINSAQQGYIGVKLKKE